jgi:hypothetical protein
MSNTLPMPTATHSLASATETPTENSGPGKFGGAVARWR